MSSRALVLILALLVVAEIRAGCQFKRDDLQWISNQTSIYVRASVAGPYKAK
jgi:hypothetical protein